jgi:hypothetical protein
MARILISAYLTALLLGCANRYAISHYSGDVTVSAGGEVILGGQAVRLISIAPAGAATIELVETGQRFSAAPGDFFSGAFGTEGLQLVSASPEKREVVLRRRWADTK